MRTTINVPDDVHARLTALAAGSRRTLSETAVLLIRRGLGAEIGAKVCADPSTGRPVLRVGRPITMEDVRSLEDDE
jgi:hypothetical protein